MSRIKEHDYDASLSTGVELTMGGKKFVFPPEAPLDVAMEWMDRQQSTSEKPAWELLGESQTEYTQGNFACIFGDNFAAMTAAGGWETLNQAYADLLDDWGLFRQAKLDGDTDLALARIETMVGLAVDDPNKRAAIGALLDQVRSAINDLQEQAEPSGNDEKETAGNPA